MKPLSVGNCRIEVVDSTSRQGSNKALGTSRQVYIVIDDVDRVLLTTDYGGVAKMFKDLYNARGSEFNLISGVWQ